MSSLRVLERLIGMETEYGLLRDSNDSHFDAGELYDSIRFWFASRLPIAETINDEQRFFTANGGCIGIARLLSGNRALLGNRALSEKRSRSGNRAPSGNWDQGMLEGATPECRSPRLLVTYQSVQDQMLAECLFDIASKKSMSWIKNSGDAYGNNYGQHENYELQIAQGWRLLAWRIGLVALLPFLIIYKLFALIWLAIVKGLNRAWQSRVKRDPLDTLIDDRPHEWRTGSSSHLSPGFVRLAAIGLRYLQWPIALLLHRLIVAFVLIPHRRWMAGFFASRAVVDGSGYLDRQGRYWLSARAASLTSIIGFGGYWNERPIFGTGHWLHSILRCESASFVAWRRLFSSRQRVQIAIGDSTPNPRAQHLRIGTTCLAFDLIESQFTNGLPKFGDCLGSLKALTTDQSLLRSICDRQDKNWTAIELQRHYASAIRHFLSFVPNVTKEAMEIVEQWQLTLDHLEESDHDLDCQRWLLGRVDWYSKRWLIDQTATTASWESQKKIDTRYHELSRHGYYNMMVSSLSIAPFSSSQQMKRSMRLPPSDTPAKIRGYWIREFADEHAALKVNWESVVWFDEFGKQKRQKIS